MREVAFGARKQAAGGHILDRRLLGQGALGDVKEAKVLALDFVEASTERIVIYLARDRPQDPTKGPTRRRPSLVRSDSNYPCHLRKCTVARVSLRVRSATLAQRTTISSEVREPSLRRRHQQGLSAGPAIAYLRRRPTRDSEGRLFCRPS